MNYTEWNKLISDYFFNENTKGEPVNLYITEDIIEELASNDEKLVKNHRKINEIRLERGDKEIDFREYALSDIRRAIIGNEIHKSVSDFFNIIHNKCNEIQKNYTVKKDDNGNIEVLLILIVFILAISTIPEEEEITSDSNFYDKVCNYLKDKHFLKFDNNNKQKTAFVKLFKNVFNETFWKSYDSFISDAGYLSTIVYSETNNRKYVTPFFSQCVIRSNQRYRMVDIFEKANLSPESELSDESIKRLLDEHGAILFNNNRDAFSQKYEEYPNAFLSVFRSEFANWDGKIRAKEVIRTINDKAETIQIDRGYIKPLKLLIDSNRQFSFCLKEEDRKEIPFGKYVLSTNNDNFIEISKSNRIAYSDISEVLRNKTDLLFEQKEDDKVFKLKFTPEKHYFFHKGDNGYTTRFDLQLGWQCLVISTEEDDDLSKWLQDNQAEVIELFNDLGNTFRVDNIHRTFKGRTQIKRKVESVDNIIVDNKIYALFPLKFSVNDINVASQEEGGDCVYMMFVNKTTPYPLKYNSDENWWELHNKDEKGRPVFDNLSKSKNFKIYVCGQSDGKFNYVPYNDIDSPEFKCSDYNLIDKYNSSQRNTFGLYDSNGTFEGLKLPEIQTKTYKKVTNEIIENIGKYKENDVFLYLLSQKKEWTRAEFVENFKLINNQYYRNEVLHNYDRLGYINYEYINGSHYVYINKPTLIQLPVYETNGNIHSRIHYEVLLVGARSVELIKQIEKYSQGCGLKIHYGEINEKNELYPQQVKILSNDVILLINLAKKFNFEFSTRNDGVPVYSKELITQIGDIADYEKTLEALDVVEMLPVDYLRNKNLIDSLDFNTATKKDDINTELDMITYGAKYKKRTYLLLNKKQYEIDKHWGNVFMMNKTNTLSKHAVFDKENRLLKVNKYIKLPRIISRALVLSTGELPTIEGQYECYKISDTSIFEGVNQNFSDNIKGTRGVRQLIELKETIK